MNRLSFFSEMKKGLMETVKAVSEPLIDEKIEQFDRATDSLLQIKWVPLADEIIFSSHVMQRYINGKPVMFFNNGKDLQAISTICPTCKNLFYFSEGDQQLKCFLCEKTFSLINGDGDLHVRFFLLREKNNCYEIGIEEKVFENP